VAPRRDALPLKVTAKWRDAVIPHARPVSPLELEASTVQVSLSIEYLFTVNNFRKQA
jgi:hypothetical protein